MGEKRPRNLIAGKLLKKLLFEFKFFKKKLQKTCSRVKFASSEVSVSWTVNFSCVYFAHSGVSISWTVNLTTCSWSLPYVPCPGLWQQSNFLIGRDDNKHVKGGLGATKGRWNLPHLWPQPASFSACSRHLGRQAALVLVSQLFIWQIMLSAFWVTSLLTLLSGNNCTNQLTS